MDWERMIPGHPGPRRPPRHQGGRQGRADADAGSLRRRSRADAQAGKCWDAVEKDFQMPKYATLPGYAGRTAAWWRGAIAGCGAAAPERSCGVTDWPPRLAAARLLADTRTAKETVMRRIALAMLACLAAACSRACRHPRAGANAPAPTPPLFATTKVEGTDNVYIFRYQGHQAMFIVTPAGVIATDPIGRYRPQAVTTYIDEIRKITSAPIRYVVYSHHHYDHIAGGKPFKDAGATFVAHKRAKERLVELNFPDVTIPDETVDNKRTIELGGTTLELDLCGAQSLRQHAVDAAAEGEADLRGRLPADQRRQLAQHARQLAVRVGGRHQEGAVAGMGSHDPRPSGTGRSARHARRRGTCSPTCRTSPRK